jgi:Conserved hypothetical protein 2217 (DUF2460)
MYMSASIILMKHRMQPFSSMANGSRLLPLGPQSHQTGTHDIIHEVLFPLDIALKSAGGPQRRTDVVTLGSGAEERNARWAHSRRRYDVKTFDALSQVVAFFEERRGRLYGFRWRDRLDHSSAAPGVSIMPTNQIIGTGDGVTATFQLGRDQGLTGDVRTTFVEAAMRSCLKAQLDAGDNMRLPVSALYEYCKCYTSGMADKISNAEVKTLEATGSEEKYQTAMQAKLMQSGFVRPFWVKQT